MFQIIKPLPWKHSFKKSSFQEIIGIFPDLLNFKVNIKKSKAIKVNIVLFMYT